MEIINSLFVFCIILFVLLFTKKRFTAKNSAAKLPPGPRRLPILGNIHLLTSSLVHRRLKELSDQYGPIMYLQLGEAPVVVISSPELAKEVMKTHDVTFSYRPTIYAARIMTYNWTSIAFSPYGNYWRQLRKICTLELLSAKRVKSFESIRNAEVSNLIDDIASSAGRAINLSWKLSCLTYAIIATAAFGKKSEDQDAFIVLVKKVTQLAAGFSISDFYPSYKFVPMITGMKFKLDKLGPEVDRILEKIVNDHMNKDREDGDKDFVDILLNIQERGDLEVPLTKENIKAVVADIFSAASETSTTMLDWTIAEMIKNPRIMKKAQSEVRKVCKGKENVEESDVPELKYLKAIVKEALRMHPAVPLLLPRENQQRCEINGYEIPEKTKVVINGWAIGRDPKNWTEPERFYPERFMDSEIDYKGTNLEYIPFGSGRRMCPGILFAIADIELPLAQLIYHFDWEMADGSRVEDLDMTEVFGLSTRRKTNLHLIPIPYNPTIIQQ